MLRQFLSNIPLLSYHIFSFRGENNFFVKKLRIINRFVIKYMAVGIPFLIKYRKNTRLYLSLAIGPWLAKQRKMLPEPKFERVRPGSSEERSRMETKKIILEEK